MLKPVARRMGAKRPSRPYRSTSIRPAQTMCLKFIPAHSGNQLESSIMHIAVKCTEDGEELQIFGTPYPLGKKQQHRPGTHHGILYPVNLIPGNRAGLPRRLGQMEIGQTEYDRETQRPRGK